MINPMLYAGLPIEAQVKSLRKDPQLILKIVAELSHVDVHDITSTSRREPIVNARMIAIYFIRRYAKMSKVQLGKLFGRDHSTIIYSIRRCSELIEVDKKFRAFVDLVEIKLRTLDNVN